MRRTAFLVVLGAAAGCSGAYGESPVDGDAAPPPPVIEAGPALNAAPGPDAGADAGGVDAAAKPDAALAIVVVGAAAGNDFVCAHRSDGAAVCWGGNATGQLGDGSMAPHNTARIVTGLTSGVTAIAAGDVHACAVVNGGAKCWGYNGSGQCGTPSATDQLVATDVSTLTTGVLAVTGGAIHSCAIVTGGGAKCWGSSGGSGGLGNGNLNSASVIPIDVTGLASGVTALATTGYSTCALRAGALSCWGGNSNGQLGNNATVAQPAPVANGLASGVTFVGGGAGTVNGNNGARHMCAVQNGAAKCWGQNAQGQLGNNSVISSSVPVAVQGLATGVVAVTANGFHSCALTSAGGVKCWGANDRGQLGATVAMQSLIPVDVTGLTSGVKSITAGGYHTCAVTTAGRIKCWGSNDVGELGNGTTGGQNAMPGDVMGL